MNSIEQNKLLDLIADIQGLQEEKAELKARVDQQEQELDISREDLADISGIIEDKVDQLDDLIAHLTGAEDVVPPFPTDFGGF